MKQMDEVIVIYADILFLIDFIMDFLCLYITGALMSVRIRLGHLVGAAVFGGVYAVCLQYLPEAPFFVLLPLHIIAAMIMIFIFCGFVSAKQFFTRTLVFALTSAFFGGILGAVFSLRGGVTVNGGGSYAEISPLFLIAVAVTSVAAAYAYGVLCRKKLSERSVKAEITYGGNDIRVLLLADTGCHVVDPMTGEAVIIVSSRIFGGNKPEMTRVIPIKSAGGVKILEAFRPESVKVNGVGVNAIIASDELNDNYSGCDGLIPIILLR